MNKSNTKYVFKTLAPKNKKEKGTECLTKGGTLSTIIGKINLLTRILNTDKRNNGKKNQDVDKYYSKLEEYKLNLTSVKPGGMERKKLGTKIYRQYDIDKNVGIPISVKNADGERVIQYIIEKRQLCIEQELLLRHLDEERINNKRWFLSTLEDNLNIWTPPDYKKKKKK